MIYNESKLKSLVKQSLMLLLTPFFNHPLCSTVLLLTQVFFILDAVGSFVDEVFEILVAFRSEVAAVGHFGHHLHFQTRMLLLDVGLAIVDQR